MSAADPDLPRERPTDAAGWHRLGDALFDQGRIDRAIAAYRRALRLDGSLAEAHNDLGTAYFEKRRYEQAEQCFRRAVRLNPEHGIAYANLGAALRAQGRIGESRRAYQRALALKIRAALPRFLRWKIAGAAEARKSYEEIAALLRARRLAQARRLARKAERRFAHDPEIARIAALVLGELGETSAALERVERALRLDPDRAASHALRCRLLLLEGADPASALQAAETALRLAPESAEVHVALALANRQRRNFAAAEQAARRALELDGGLAAAHDALAVALWPQERYDEAIAAAQGAVQLEPANFAFRLNLALILFDAGRVPEAGAIYRELSPVATGLNHPHVRLNMGTLALNCAADAAAARRWYGDLQDPEIVLGGAVADLLEQRFEPGWRKFEARKRAPSQRERHDVFAGFASWDGRELKDETLLVYGEQGIGDEILFASMLSDLAGRARRISLMCDERLVALFARSFPHIEVVPARYGMVAELRTRVACAVAAGSLGMHFRRGPADFPAHRGYLVPDAEKTAAWRDQLATLGSGAKIGISWRGGMLKTGRHRRSLAPEALRPLLEMPGVTWVSLQHGADPAEIERLAESAGVRLHAFPGVTRDMDELASLVQALDRVVSVSNTTVHVAGALGKEALVILPVVPLWAYGLRGERMLWYPSVRLFRQRSYGDWDEVIGRVAEALRRAP